ncbi:hypothetical protein Kisp01_69720 [Kineosporia sp. NBRC 101677]|uniref:DUF397 domain-containing protein n=1 Tax=Kineosporia sp. NBRC 101677 TaxID=3032197 RepID=UPI00249FFCC6|nr:DUF397 domain-containing protein [Kineosporia sp. NBRC 101677]GLY19958.1 hypothetical protein Kisp01_69720 [Kineosporia sp. NBRC 101677]
MSPQAPIDQWFKAEESDPGTDGVEVKFAVDGSIYVRDSRARGTGPILTFLPQAWEAFVRAVLNGEFDRPPMSMFDKAITHP